MCPFIFGKACDGSSTRTGKSVVLYRHQFKYLSDCH